MAIALPNLAHAHLGSENNTEIRVYSDSMRLVLRTSVPFAWSLMGDGAPMLADEAGQAAATPLLIAATPKLFSISAGGKTMVPTHVDCMFEVGNDVAFILNFPRPSEWPVSVNAQFFNQAGNLEAGTIAVFDYTASRFLRDPKPIATQRIDQGHPEFSFSLFKPPLVVLSPKQAESPPLSVSVPESRNFKPLAAPLLVAAAVALVWLARKRQSGRDAGS